MKHKLNNILLIDDDNMNNLFSKTVLEDVNCTLDINIKNTPGKALIYLAQCAKKLGKPGNSSFPDLIFLDLNMPGMDGWQFISEYKKITDTFWHDPVVIVLSSFSSPATQLKVSEIPEISGIYGKPMTTEMLNEVFDKYFPDYV